MIPILYEAFEHDFQNNGICRLSDAISCEITEERNGKYELTMVYPMTGVRFDEIKEGRLIYVTHDENGDCQPFEIYRRSAVIDGKVTFNARHISYRLSKVILKPFTVGSIALALVKLKNETFNENPFEFWTDKSTTAKFSVNIPSSIRSVLGGSVGSILDVYGGEFEFDKFLVKIWNHRGNDNGVTVRYGKNLTSLTQTLDTGSLYNAIVPYWTNTAGDCVYGNPVTAQGGVKNRAKWNEEHGIIMTDEHNTEMEFDAYSEDVTVMNFSEDFKDEKPTPKQLEEKAKAYLASNTPWLANENIKFDFVALWQTDEYADIAPLERVKLCDTVTVKYTALGVSAKAKVVKVVWDALADRYSSVEVGDARTSFGEAISREIQKAVEDRPTITEMDMAIDTATKLLTGGLGGHIVFNTDADGHPNEMYIMDTDDVNTAVRVWRYNLNGWGVSNNGINGTYRLAATLENGIVADFITTGTLSANLIKAGTLSSRDGKSFWDLDSSQFRFYDNTFDSYVELDEGYIDFAHGNESFGRIIRRTNSGTGEDVLAVEGPSRETFIVLLKNIIRLWSENDYFQLNGEEHSTQLKNASSHVRMYDNADNQFADINSGGNTYIRVDGKSNYVRTQAGNDAYIRIDGDNEYTTIQQGTSYIRLDNADDYVDIHIDNDNYIRLDKGQGKLWIKTPEIMYNGYGGYTGTLTVNGQTLFFNNGALTQVS